MTYQEVLTMSTMDSSLRSEVQGWSLDSGLEAHKAMVERGNACEVWRIGPPRKFHTHKTPLHALGAGYKLLAPPTEFKQELDISEEYFNENGCKYGLKGPGRQTVSFWEWWFVKEVTP